MSPETSSLLQSSLCDSTITEPANNSAPAVPIVSAEVATELPATPDTAKGEFAWTTPASTLYVFESALCI